METLITLMRIPCSSRSMSTLYSAIPCSSRSMSASSIKPPSFFSSLSRYSSPPPSSSSFISDSRNFISSKNIFPKVSMSHQQNRHLTSVSDSVTPDRPQGSSFQGGESFFRCILASMEAIYLSRNPTAKSILELVHSVDNEHICYDHFAFRTFGVNGHGIDSMAGLFLDFGYVQREELRFPAKKLKAFWFSPPKVQSSDGGAGVNGPLPRIFISELLVDELSPQAQEIIRRYTAQSNNGNKHASLASCLGSLTWEKPSYAEFLQLASESEYAAWTLVNGYALNHLTVSTHRLKSHLRSIKNLNQFIEENGYKLNSEGGILKDLQAVVVTAFATKEQNNGCTTRDFIVVNEEKKPMLLTLWNEFEQNQGTQLANSIGNANVIIGMKLKITTFNYLSLTTKPGSGLLINPPTSEANALKDWYNANKEEIAELIQQMAYKDSSKLLPPPSSNDIISVANALNTLKDVKTVWITGKISLSPGQQKFWFEPCENCQKAINVDVGWVMRCSSCKEESRVIARTRVGIAVDDGTGSINTVIFGLDAEKLIPFTALQFWEAHTEELNFSAELASALGKHAIVCFIRYYESDYQGQKEGKYNIVKAYTAEESAHIPMAITTAETNEIIPDRQATVLQPTKKTEFFSPSTKKILDAIAESSTATNELPPAVTTAKRALVFGTVPPGIGLNSAEANTPTLLSTNAPGSPLKKQRDDEL